MENLLFDSNKRTLLHSIDYFTTQLKNLKITNNILPEGENLLNLHYSDINVPGIIYKKKEKYFIN